MAESSGFSLLELIVVLSLVSILAGIGVLSHQVLRPTLDLSAGTRQVVMALKIARMRAVTQNTSHRVVFTKGAGGYQLQRRGAAGYVDAGARARLPPGVVVVACSARNAAISFRPRGNPGSFGTVVMQNGQGEVRRVIVDMAGQVRVQ
ncbi:MAG: GspH/FimT family pseudopilin [Candidatus Binatia bacterium]